MRSCVGVKIVESIRAWQPMNMQLASPMINVEQDIDGIVRKMINSNLATSTKHMNATQTNNNN